MEKEVSASYEATKTNESCLLFNKSEDNTEFFLNLSPKEIKHTVVEMPVGIGMSSYLEKLWKEGKLWTTV